ncbi:hypothetical protein RBB50_009566 [Rhinocladiella similis]
MFKFPGLQSFRHHIASHRLSRHLKQEPKKVIVSASKRRALLHCLPHILPILASVTVLALNFHGKYLGADFDVLFDSETLTLMGLQIIAKIHEVFIVASLSLIVFHVIRHELLYGIGLPLGLIGSGFNFGSFDFFLKKEFWGALHSWRTTGHRRRKAAVVFLLCAAGFVAALAGPSSATLIVPTSQTWPTGSTDFYLPGSPEDVWPSDVSKDAAVSQQFCSNGTSSTLAICPAGGFLSIREHWGRANFTDFLDADVPPYSRQLSGSRFFWPVHSPSSPVPPLYALGGARSMSDYSPGGQTFLVQPHAAAATVLQQIATQWWQALKSRWNISDSQIDDRKVSARIPAAITVVRCSEPQNLSTTDKSVQFPVISGRFDYINGTNFIVDTLNDSAVDHLRFQWVHLPDNFGAASIGGVFESAWTQDKSSRVVLGCTAQAGWVPAVIQTDEYSFWTGWYPWGIDFGARTPAWTQIPSNQPQSLTNGRVAMDDNWLKLLTPSAPLVQANQHGWMPSTLESVIDASALAEGLSGQQGLSLTEAWVNDGQSGISRAVLLEVIISSILVDGLSRIGLYKIFDTEGQESRWSLSAFDPLPDFAKRILAGRNALRKPTQPSTQSTLHVKMEITGFALRASLAGFLSMAVLSAHILMAIGHIGCVFLFRESSTGWESISELIALTQNSRPAYFVLENTAAGIERGRTYGRVANIRVKPTLHESITDHVELVFQDATGKSDSLQISCPKCDRRKPQEESSAVVDELAREEELEMEMQDHGPETETDITHLRLGGRWPSTWPRTGVDPLPLHQSALRPASTTQRARSLVSRSRSGSNESLILQTGMESTQSDLVLVDQKYG